MKPVYAFLLLLLISCSGTQKKELLKDPVLDFFTMCEKDIAKASQVIVERDIVKNLSHLMFMNYGGKKYYILERESITKMIKAVTKGVYQDFILINKSGTIVYTMSNNDIFGGKVRSSLKNTPYGRSYSNRNVPVYYQDVTALDNSGEQYAFFLSNKVSGGNSFPGIFILQINYHTLCKLFGPDSELISADGRIRCTANMKRLLKIHPAVAKHTGDPSEVNAIAVEKALKNEGISYRIIQHENIHWFLTN